MIVCGYVSRGREEANVPARVAFKAREDDMAIGSFKYWYTIEEAAKVCADNLAEPITASDIIDKVNYQELRAWFDGTGRYARTVYPASHYKPDTKKNPFAAHGMVDYLSPRNKPILGLMGYYEIYTGPRSGMVIFVPVDDATADAHWNGGNLILDHDGETLLQIVRRKPDAHIGSRTAIDFIPDTSRLPRDRIWIATEDLRALLEPQLEPETRLSLDLGVVERKALRNLVAAMAIKNYEYEPGKKQKKGVISEIQKHLKELKISMSDDTLSKYLKEATAEFAKSTNSIATMTRQVTIRK